MDFAHVVRECRGTEDQPNRLYIPAHAPDVSEAGKVHPWEHVAFWYRDTLEMLPHSLSRPQSHVDWQQSLLCPQKDRALPLFYPV
jgi:hypothetical protein